METGMRYYGLFFASLLSFTVAVSAAEPAITPPRDCAFVLDSTYEQRVAASAANKTADADMLVLPQPGAKSVFPNPFRLAAGKMISGAAVSDNDTVVWKLVPKTDTLAAYLEKLNSQPQPALALVDWCEKNKLPLCAEFELRRLLRTFKNYSESGYQPVYTRWLKYADRRFTSYSFPLPVNGEWFTQPSPVHRLHSESTYAMDLLAVKDGSTLKKAPARMEDYYSWGQPIVAQADGVVVLVRDDNVDNKLGEMRGADANNFVFVDYGGGLIGNYAHIQQYSAKVKQGDRVKAGEMLALVGASGAAAVPHLHYTLRDAGWFSIQGRLRFEYKAGTAWKRADGDALKENLYVRNVENAFGAK